MLFLATPVVIARKLVFSECRGYDRKEYFLTQASFIFALGVVVYNWFISCAFNVGEPRFHRPVDFLMIFVIMLLFFSKRENWRLRRFS